jgi:glutamate-1-semialdehyde aminotransferase
VRLSYGAQALFDVIPDLTLLGRSWRRLSDRRRRWARRHHEMFNPAADSVAGGTFHTNPVALAAGSATLRPATAEALNN